MSSAACPAYRRGGAVIAEHTELHAASLNTEVHLVDQTTVTAPHLVSAADRLHPLASLGSVVPHHVANLPRSVRKMQYDQDLYVGGGAIVSTRSFQIAPHSSHFASVPASRFASGRAQWCLPSPSRSTRAVIFGRPGCAVLRASNRAVSDVDVVSSLNDAGHGGTTTRCIRGRPRDGPRGLRSATVQDRASFGQPVGFVLRRPRFGLCNDSKRAL